MVPYEYIYGTLYEQLIKPPYKKTSVLLHGLTYQSELTTPYKVVHMICYVFHFGFNVLLACGV
jgi:hypothetical protein